MLKYCILPPELMMEDVFDVAHAHDNTKRATCQYIQLSYFAQLHMLYVPHVADSISHVH